MYHEQHYFVTFILNVGCYIPAIKFVLNRVTLKFQYKRKIKNLDLGCRSCVTVPLELAGRISREEEKEIAPKKG